MATQQDAAWWRGAVIYQIYPRSFLDTDGDGVGDLPGIIERLDYVASLGVDAIWISPFFKSPMADFGYDIADYRDVDPLFGTLDDFDRAAGQGAFARPQGDDRPGAQPHFGRARLVQGEPREPRQRASADWYVWADAKPDGTPPNNWLSMFGGVAWRWEPRRGQYYLHNFLSSQPDLNFHNPAVRAATLDNVKFWLDRGVDGLRLDAINFCFHDAQLRDNPPKPVGAAHRPRLQPGQSVRVPVPPLQQHAAGEPRVPRGPARAARPLSAARPRSARSPRRTRWRRWPSTSTTSACTWATASSC